MNVMMTECGNVNMWKCENESRISRILQFNIIIEY